MAGIITISKGHDASYPWKQIGTSDRGQDRTGTGGAGYYLSPAERGGEPPGIWTGKGVPELGLRPGGVVDRAVFEPLYGQHLDPRDPAGQVRLGRAPGRYRAAEEIYAALLAAEPHATAERRDQLMVEAKARVRTPDLYWDATFSVSKSVSLFHASALANAVAAAQAGDLAAAATWQEVADGIWAAVMEGNAAGLDYLQHEAGQTRAGYHPGGRWEDAREWVIASFRQHTSRDGDPQLHVHNLILHKVKRESDGQWRALDSMSLYRQRPAASAIATLAMENALTRRFGVGWVPRRDGHGREIADVHQALMDMFSSRRRSIGPLTGRLAQAYEAQFGRVPDARALTSLRQWANHATRRGKDSEPLDLAALVRRWSAQASASEAGALEPLAPAVLRGASPPAQAPGQDPATPDAEPAAPEPSPARAQAAPGPLTDAQAQRLIQEAVAAVQAAQPTWTEADLIRHLGERLPAEVPAMSHHDAATLLPALARRALAAEAVMLSAPEWPRVPDSLRRASGESLYIPHGAARYTTGAQLDLEERLLVQAQETGAPRLEPATVALFLGAEQAHLEAQLQAQDTGPGAITQSTGCGLRLDQAVAAYRLLTSVRRAEVMAGPAGSGKTRTVAEMARVWRESGMGEVIGLTTSQTAANVLNEAGVTRAYNTARFLGHLKDRREARGALPVTPGSLLILDEASMMSLADMAAILNLAHHHDCKVVITGDHEQLAAVEGGGAMMMLARRQGYVQLTEPQRFTHEWERDATLRLRTGDVTVLAEYEEHGRLRGGTPDEATEQAYRGWLADFLDGKDTLLMARTEDQARELSRRARDDLIRYGLVSAGPHLSLACGERASAGDLVMARRNIRTAHPGRELTNRDVLQITSTAADLGGLRAEVRRLLGRDPATGEARWSEPFQVPKRYLADHACLAYATTQHAALGRTVDTAHVLVDGLGGRQGLYVAMSRGRDANYAYCITQYPRLADIREGTRPAPELDRARRLARERAGLPTPQTAGGGDEMPVLDPVTVLAGVLARDGSELSATETLERELSNADHIGVLGGIWDDLTRRAQHTRFEQALRDALPTELAEQALADPACTWLWRTLREAETAGLDGTQVLRQAIAVRGMDGARDPARVLDARIRRRLGSIQPQPPGPFASRVLGTSDPDLARYLRELAEAMDERTRRLGEHAAQTQPLWAIQGLGPLPPDAAARADWEHRAGVVATYRERYGYAHPADPIGPAPGRTSPEARAAWHAALAALGRVDGIDLRNCTDGDLWLRRGTYERETAWAPPHVAEELRLMRVAQRDAHVKAVRAEHEAHAATDEETAGRHRRLAQVWRALEAKAAREADLFTAVQETRRQWEAVTESTRRIAIAADLELRRRHPGMVIATLRPHPAEADGLPRQEAPAPGAGKEVWVQLTLDGSAHLLPGPIPRQQQNELASSRQRETAGQLVLGLTPEAAHEGIPEQVLRIRDNAKTVQAKLDELANTPLPGAEEDDLSPGLAWPAQSKRERAAVLQPPKPELVPSAQVVERYQAA
ncbi:MAG TPA: MobF family relaxase [Streptosporangiaceae bacterium]|nr:MobF family relaxase [Streptosporangiaceae bacterium]